MKNNNYVTGSYFCGNKISEYGLRYNRVDYHTFAKSFDAVLNNNIMAELEGRGFYFELENGFVDNSEDIANIEEAIEELEALIEAGAVEKQAQLEELREELEELEENDGSYPECEVYQYYIVSDNGARIISDYTNQLLWYCEEIDMYIWGVCHYGTSWDYVLTDIKCNYDPVNNN